jgi:hypothetical protein
MGGAMEIVWFVVAVVAIFVIGYGVYKIDVSSRLVVNEAVTNDDVPSYDESWDDEQVAPLEFKVGSEGEVLVYGLRKGDRPATMYVSQLLAIEKSIPSMMRFFYDYQSSLKWGNTDKASVLNEIENRYLTSSAYDQPE